MKKNNSLFKKYFLIISSIILLSFIFLSIIVTLFISNYWEQEKIQSLKKNNLFISSLVMESYYQDQYGQYYLKTSDLDLINRFITVYSGYNDVDVFVTTSNGYVLLSSNNKDSIKTKTAIPPYIHDQSLNGEIYLKGTLGGLYNEEYYITAKPLVLSDNTVVGCVYATTSARSVNDFRRNIMNMICIAGVFAAFASFIAVWILTYRMILPLKQMAIAAKSFGNGDFSQRIAIRSNDEIADLGNALNNMASSLSVSENIRRSFIANVSHELKTPMTTIAGFVDGILDGTIPPEKEGYYLKIISSEVKRLSRLVRSMLDLSRIDSEEMKLNRTQTDLTNIVFSALLTFENQIEEKNLEIRGLEHTEPIYIMCDADLIHQVVYNLFENAVKFVNPDGYIEIKISSFEDKVSVNIRNSGAGIAPEELSLIFDRFYKTDKSRSHDKNGMGLGLYIVRTILKFHGGDINVRSMVNEYTEFEFILPKNIKQINSTNTTEIL